MIDFYFDENFCDWSIVRPLRSTGFDVVTALDAGLTGVRDDEQFAFARSTGRVIVTTDEGDFDRLSSALLRDGGTHPGIVVARRRGVSVGEMIAALTTIGRLDAQLMVDRVEHLSRWVRSGRS